MTKLCRAQWGVAAAKLKTKHRLDKPYRILPVGVDDSVFMAVDPTRLSNPYPPGVLQFLFFGSFIPLQGIEHIIAAADLLAGQGFRFTLVGRGQIYAEMKERTQAARTASLDFVASVPEAGLIPYLVHADVSLGLFADSLKAAKVDQAAP